MGVGDQHFLDRHFLVAARTGAVHHAQVGFSALGIHAWQGLAFVSLGGSGGWSSASAASENGQATVKAVAT